MSCLPLPCLPHPTAHPNPFFNPNLPHLRSLFEALNRRDVSAVLTLMSEEVVYDSLSTSASLRGRAAVGRFYLEVGWRLKWLPTVCRCHGLCPHTRLCHCWPYALCGITTTTGSGGYP